MYSESRLHAIREKKDKSAKKYHYNYYIYYRRNRKKSVNRGHQNGKVFSDSGITSQSKND